MFVGIFFFFIWLRVLFCISTRANTLPSTRRTAVNLKVSLGVNDVRSQKQGVLCTIPIKSKPRKKEKKNDQRMAMRGGRDVAHTINITNMTDYCCSIRALYVCECAVFVRVKLQLNWNESFVVEFFCFIWLCLSVFVLQKVIVYVIRSDITVLQNINSVL